jgi:hypothetical protein
MIVGAANSEGQLKEHGKQINWTVAAFFDLRLPYGLAEQSSFEILDCVTETVPDTVEDLGFNVDEYGWKVSISETSPIALATHSSCAIRL